MNFLMYIVVIVLNSVCALAQDEAAPKVNGLLMKSPCDLVRVDLSHVPDFKLDSDKKVCVFSTPEKVQEVNRSNILRLLTNHAFAMEAIRDLVHKAESPVSLCTEFKLLERQGEIFNNCLDQLNQMDPN